MAAAASSSAAAAASSGSQVYDSNVCSTPCGLLKMRHLTWAVTAATYCMLNISLNDYNYYLFGSSEQQRHLEVPVFYTFINFVLTVVVWTPVLFCFDFSSCSPEVQRRAGFLKWDSFKKHWHVLVMLSTKPYIDLLTYARLRAIGHKPTYVLRIGGFGPCLVKERVAIE